ncbi:MAG: glycosyltransferase family 9 protein [Planctomycetota bacterium]|jgi:ADP-heptose:LPS heptosyltransferase|nr:glycosyltransferase family 9 protein [Planctomycetota bacterium]
MSAGEWDGRNFLIVRLSALGDTVHALPFAAALREACPNSRIGWVVEEPAADLVVDNPLLDCWHVVPRGWLKSFRIIKELRRSLRNEEYDVAFDIQGLSKSAIAAWLSGAELRVGFIRGESREIAPNLDNCLVPPTGVHVVDKVLSLLNAISVPIPHRGTFIFPPFSGAGALGLQSWLDQNHLHPQEFALFGPWGSFSSKIWPLERFAALSSMLYQECHLPALVLGHGEAERQAVTEIATRLRPGSFILAPELPLLGVVELARRARIFIGNDSFPLHAAAGVGCPCLGLFGVTDPDRLGPYSEKSRVVYERLTIMENARDYHQLDKSTLFALGVEKVYRACLDVMVDVTTASNGSFCSLSDRLAGTAL